MIPKPILIGLTSFIIGIIVGREIEIHRQLNWFRVKLTEMAEKNNKPKDMNYGGENE